MYSVPYFKMETPKIFLVFVGHQKKVMLAIERLLRIQSGSRRISTLERRGSTEMLEPASNYPTPKWLGDQAAQYSPEVIRTPRRSPSGENLPSIGHYTPGIAEIKSFHSPEHHGSQEILNLRKMTSCSKNSMLYQPDVVAIQVNRGTPTRGSIDESSTTVTYQSFQGPFNEHNKSLEETSHSDGEMTLARDRTMGSIDDLDGSSTLRRTAMVSPRIAPKPKPIAKIVAKSKRTSRDVSSDIIKIDNSPIIDSCGGSPGYSGTLGRKSTFHQSEPIYDLPADLASSQPGSPACSGSNSCNISHYAVSPVNRTKKPPPPPPKRTNSIKSESIVSYKKTSSEGSTPTSGSYIQSPQQPGFSSCVKSLSDKFAHQDSSDGNSPVGSPHKGGTLERPKRGTLERPKGGTLERPKGGSLERPKGGSLERPKGGTLDRHKPVVADKPKKGGTLERPKQLDTAGQMEDGADSNSKPLPRSESDNISLPDQPIYDYTPPQCDDFPPPPPPISATTPRQHIITNNYAVAADDNNPLTEAIHRLEHTSSRKSLSDWKDDDSDTDSGFGAKRNESSSSIDSTGTITSADMLPFANENVGTIKQRNNSNNKPSIVTVSMEEGGEKSLDLNSSIFSDNDDGTATVKRNPKAVSTPVVPAAAQAQSLPRGEHQIKG